MTNEEAKHGPNHVGQIIGELTRDAELELTKDSGAGKPRLWGGIKVQRFGNNNYCHYVYYIYAGDSHGEADEAVLEEAAAHLVAGTRVKMQGRMDIRPMPEMILRTVAVALGLEWQGDVLDSDDNLDNRIYSEIYHSGRSVISMWLSPQDLKDLTTGIDQKGKRPVTVLEKAKVEV